jgi:tripartite-type tricarboxylate transporter receptor subunit TctC
MKKILSLSLLSVFTMMFCFLVSINLAESAEKYPSRPVTTIVGFAPGGVSDMTMRIWNKYLEKYMGGTFVVDHKPGAGGIVAFSYVANAKPDGYTLLNHADYFLPVLNGTATYKMEDLRIIAQASRNGSVMVVNANAPWKTFQEFYDYCKKNPGVKWGNNGAGAMVYFRMQNLNKQASMKLTSVPFKGDAEVISAILGNHVAVGNLSAVAARAQAEAGKLRIIFSFDPPKDFGLDPSLPTMATRFPKIQDIDVGVYLIAPSKTPEDIVNTLEKAMEKMTKDPGFVKDCATIGHMVNFASGKTIMKKTLPTKMNIVKDILNETAQAK